MLAGARWYHPGLFRWLTRDPIGYEGGFNLYQYVGGRPVVYVDPSGLASLDTDMTNGYTEFDPRPEESGPSYRIPTRNDVDRRSRSGADEAFTSGDVNSRLIGPSRAYGPSGAYIDTGDSRGRDIHGGGSCFSFSDSQIPRQGWCPTRGCTRGQNEDVIRLGNEINRFKKNNPGVKIPYKRY